MLDVLVAMPRLRRLVIRQIMDENLVAGTVVCPLTTLDIGDGAYLYSYSLANLVTLLTMFSPTLEEVGMRYVTSKSLLEVFKLPNLRRLRLAMVEYRQDSRGRLLPPVNGLECLDIAMGQLSCTLPVVTACAATLRELRLDANCGFPLSGVSLFVSHLSKCRPVRLQRLAIVLPSDVFVDEHSLASSRRAWHACLPKVEIELENRRADESYSAWKREWKYTFGE